LNDFRRRSMRLLTTDPMAFMVRGGRRSGKPVPDADLDSLGYRIRRPAARDQNPLA